MSILDEAHKLTSGDRREAYGHPRENFTMTANMWSAYLKHNVEPRDVAMLMVLLKVARDSSSPKHDNLVDGAGYFRTAEMLDEE